VRQVAHRNWREEPTGRPAGPDRGQPDHPQRTSSAWCPRAQCPPSLCSCSNCSLRALTSCLQFAIGAGALVRPGGVGVGARRVCQLACPHCLEDRWGDPGVGPARLELQQGFEVGRARLQPQCRPSWRLRSASEAAAAMSSSSGSWTAPAASSPGRAAPPRLLLLLFLLLVWRRGHSVAGAHSVVAEGPACARSPQSTVCGDGCLHVACDAWRQHAALH
jgi:hypothetical protein